MLFESMIEHLEAPSRPRQRASRCSLTVVGSPSAIADVTGFSMGVQTYRRQIAVLCLL